MRYSNNSCYISANAFSSAITRSSLVLLSGCNQRRSRRNQPVFAYLRHSSPLQPLFHSWKRVAGAADGGHGEGHELDHERGEVRVMGLIGDLIDEDEQTAWFERSGNFCEQGGIGCERQQVGDVEVESRVKLFGERESEIFAHDVGAEEAEAVFHALLLRCAFACLDTRLNVYDGGMQRWIFAAEEDAVGRVRAAEVEQVRRSFWESHTGDYFAAQCHGKGRQPGVVALQGSLHFWRRGIFFVGHGHCLFVCAHHFWQVVPDRHDIGTVNDVGGNVERGVSCEPAPRQWAIAVAVVAQAHITGGNQQLHQQLQSLRVAVELLRQCFQRKRAFAERIKHSEFAGRHQHFRYTG